MRKVELTPMQLQDQAVLLAEQVAQHFRPDCVLFIARAGEQVARPIAQLFGVPIQGIDVMGSKGGFKHAVSPILRRLPENTKSALRRVELELRFLWRGSVMVRMQPTPHPADVHKVLLVDDSVDTGATMMAALQLVRQHFTRCQMRTAALNVWDRSSQNLNTDYHLYTNTLLETPMSRDSRHYPASAAAFHAEGRRQ